MAEGRILITGTGRSGTSLLVAILSDLGLDTGFASGVSINADRNAGLEQRIRSADAPRIVKAPGAMFAIDDILAEGVALEHVIVPLRDLDVAAASRVRVADYGRSQGRAGGLIGTWRPGAQQRILAEGLYAFLRVVAEHEIPITLLAFPRFASDWEYAYRRLGFLAPEIEASAWQSAVESRYDPGLVHEQPLTFGEQCRAVATIPLSMAGRLRRRFRG